MLPLQLALYYMASRNDTKQCTLLAVLTILRLAEHISRFSYYLFAGAKETNHMHSLTKWLWDTSRGG